MKPTTKVFTGLSAVAIAGAAFYYAYVYDPFPIAMPDTFQADDIAIFTITPLENDTDAQGDLLRIISVGTATGGTVEIDASSQAILYTPILGFSGADQFTYTIEDPAGQKAVSEISLEVKFTAPRFHQRNGSAPLQEMLSEPATSVYGSTIDVFVYRDSRGNIREITISGHAD